MLLSYYNKPTQYPLFTLRRIMKLKKAIENILVMYMPEEKRHFEESSEMAIEHNIDIGESDHIYFSFFLG